MYRTSKSDKYWPRYGFLALGWVLLTLGERADKDDDDRRARAMRARDGRGEGEGENMKKREESALLGP